MRGSGLAIAVIDLKNNFIFLKYLPVIIPKYLSNMRPIEVALSHNFVFYNAFQVVVFTCVHRKDVEFTNIFNVVRSFVIINYLK